jgi:hypothetical protein
VCSIPDEVIRFFNWPNPSTRTTAFGLARKADNLTTICEPIVSRSVTRIAVTSYLGRKRMSIISFLYGGW